MSKMNNFHAHPALPGLDATTSYLDPFVVDHSEPVHCPPRQVVVDELLPRDLPVVRAVHSVHHGKADGAQSQER